MDIHAFKDYFNPFMDKNKKIALVITRMVPGGAALVVRDIISFSDSHYSFTLYTGTEDISEEWIEPLRDKAVIVTVKSMVRRISPLNDFSTFLFLLREFRKNSFDIIHTHTSKAGFIGRLAGYFARVPRIIHSAHGSIYAENANIPGVSELPFRKKILLVAERFVGLFSDSGYIRVLSIAEKELSIRLGLAKPEKIIVIPNGINTASFRKSLSDREAARKALGLTRDDFYIVSVGRLSAEKGHKILIQAFAKALKENRKGRILLGIAGDGPLKAEIERENKNMIADGNLTLYGYSSDVRKYLFAGDIFVLPSLYEGFGIALLEAMAAGLPIIAGNVGGVPELVGTDFDGFLYPPSDCDRLSELLKQARGRKSGPDGADEGKANILRAESFNIKAIIEKYYDLYR